MMLLSRVAFWLAQVRSAAPPPRDQIGAGPSGRCRPSAERLRMRRWCAGVRFRFERAARMRSAVLQIQTKYSGVVSRDDDLAVTGWAPFLRHRV